MRASRFWESERSMVQLDHKKEEQYWGTNLMGGSQILQSLYCSKDLEYPEANWKPFTDFKHRRKWTSNDPGANFNVEVWLHTPPTGSSPEVKDLVPGDFPPPSPLQMPTVSPDCRLYFWLISYRLGVPMTHFSLDSINLLEQFTELRKTFYLPD